MARKQQPAAVTPAFTSALRRSLGFLAPALLRLEGRIHDVRDPRQRDLLNLVTDVRRHARGALALMYQDAIQQMTHAVTDAATLLVLPTKEEIVRARTLSDGGGHTPPPADEVPDEAADTGADHEDDDNKD